MLHEQARCQEDQQQAGDEAVDTGGLRQCNTQDQGAGHVALALGLTADGFTGSCCCVAFADAGADTCDQCTACADAAACQSDTTSQILEIRNHKFCPPKRCVCFGRCRGELLLTGSTFDEDGGQGTEDERLDAAAEPVEIQARKGRDADLEQLDVAQNARQPAKDDMAQTGQRPVQQCGDDRTGQDVAKVTERHADGGGYLRQHIDGCHDEDGVQKAFQIRKDAVGLDLVIHDQHEHHDGPGRFGVEVRGGAPQADDTDQVAPDAECEDRADERDILVEVIAHVIVHELVKPCHDELGCSLPLGDILQLEAMPQPDGQARKQRHDDPGTDQGLGDLEIAQKGDVGMDGIQDLCAVQFHLLRFTPFVTGFGFRLRCRLGVVLHRDIHRRPGRGKRLVLAGYLQVINRNAREKQRQCAGKRLKARCRNGNDDPKRLQQHADVIGCLQGRFAALLILLVDDLLHHKADAGKIADGHGGADEAAKNNG